MTSWGVFFASHGYIAMTIGPNDEINEWHIGRAEGLIDAIETVNLHKITGKTVAIDASMFMYKMLINMRGKNESYLKNENGKVISHIAGIFYKTSNYLAVNKADENFYKDSKLSEVHF